MTLSAEECSFQKQCWIHLISIFFVKMYQDHYFTSDKINSKMDCRFECVFSGGWERVKILEKNIGEYLWVFPPALWQYDW